MKNASRMCPSLLAPLASSRNTSWNRLKFGRSGTSVTSDRTRASNAARSPARLREPLVDLARDSASALTSSAASLRVLLMLVCSSTLLRDVLLIWMSNRSARSPLNWVPSRPEAPQSSVSRVGSSANSSLSQASSSSFQVECGWP